MFKRNTKHTVQQLFATQYEMNQTMQEKLRGHWSGTFYRTVFTKIKEDHFSEIYDPFIGRGNFPVNILVSLEILKEMEELTDIQLMERYQFDLGFRNAMGLEDINLMQMAPRTLYYFRSALAEVELNKGYNLLEIVFTELRDRIIKVFGIKTDIQRGDSFLIGANIKKMGRLMLFHKALSNLVKTILKMEIPVEKTVLNAVSDDEDNYLYQLTKEEYQDKTIWLAEKLYEIVIRNFWKPGLRKEKSFRQAVRLLREQCKVKKDLKKLELKTGSEISSGSMQNPSDDEATYRKKNGEKYHGFKAQAIETCNPENPFQVVTDIKVDKNNVDDSEMLIEQLNRIPEAIKPDVFIGDGGLITEKVRKETSSEEKEIKLVQTGIRGIDFNRLKNRIGLEEFQKDENGHITSCPDGQKSISEGVDKHQNSVAKFDQKICELCPRISDCPVSHTAKLSRLVLNDRLKALDTLRKEINKPDYQEYEKLRPAVEGLMNLLKDKYLSGRILFRGLDKISSRIFLRGIAVNFKRVIGHLLKNPEIAPAF
jgi:hypothetical protein